jgi:hypothetical protein
VFIYQITCPIDIERDWHHIVVSVRIYSSACEEVIAAIPSLALQALMALARDRGAKTLGEGKLSNISFADATYALGLKLMLRFKGLIGAEHFGGHGRL